MSTINKIFTNRAFSWSGRILLTILVCFTVNRSVSWQQIGDLARHGNFYTLGIALILGAASIILGAMRWHALLRYAGLRVSRLDALGTVLWGNALALVTPGRIGDFFKGVGIDAKRSGDLVICAVIDRFFAAGTALLASVVAMALWSLYRARFQKPLLFVIESILLIVGIVAMVYFSQNKIRAGTDKGRLIKAVDKLHHLTPVLWSHHGLIAIGYSIASYTVLIAQSGLILSMYGTGSISTCIVVMAQAYAFMTFFPFLIANIGLREYAIGLFLAPFISVQNVSAIALSASLAILAINIILPAIAGVCLKFFVAWERHV